MVLTELYSILDSVLEGKVFYGSNVYDNDDNATMPFIVYQEISKRPSGFADNHVRWYRSSVQITLVTKAKDIALEEKLEKTLLGKDLAFSLLSESRNADKSMSRVYEIYMEEI
jgi:hypothetical protein